MDQLPLEILEKILIAPKLSVQDVVAFSSTCHYFREIILDCTSVWKQKYLSEWPQMVDFFITHHNYLEELKYVYALRQRTIALLETMPCHFYKKWELSDKDLHKWGFLLMQQEQAYHYLVGDLMRIVNANMDIQSIESVPLSTPGNKTMQYYASKVLRYIQQLYLTKVWQEFLSLPPREQILEKGAVLVAQWCQPYTDIPYKGIAEKLDKIAAACKKRLFELNPHHGIFKASEKDLAQWRTQIPERNLWTVADCREVIVAMRDVLYGEMGFSGNCDAYYVPQNSFINKVLETRQGIPITLAVLYESVGRRLGLLFEPINFPAHFLLRFVENDQTEDAWYYIDIFNSGNIIRQNACPRGRRRSKLTRLPVATAVEVVERMANNLELTTRQHSEPNGRATRLRSILELIKLVSPQDLSALVSLAKLYMLHNMDTKPLEFYLMTQRFNMPLQAQRILHMLRDFAGHHQQNENDILNSVVVAQRTSNLKYAVGMVMTHSSLNYKCVIYDWDPVCLATAEWQLDMAVNKLSLKNEQPFYNVLVEDGSYRYVAQETLVPTTEVGTLHLIEDLGRHFSHFFVNHYVPNAEKENEYPEDTKVRHQYYHRSMLAKYQL